MVNSYTHEISFQTYIVCMQHMGQINEPGKHIFRQLGKWILSFMNFPRSNIHNPNKGIYLRKTKTMTAPDTCIGSQYFPISRVDKQMKENIESFLLHCMEHIKPKTSTQSNLIQIFGFIELVGYHFLEKNIYMTHNSIFCFLKGFSQQLNKVFMSSCMPANKCQLNIYWILGRQQHITTTYSYKRPTKSTFQHLLNNW